MNQGLILLNMTGFSPKKCAEIFSRLDNPDQLLSLAQSQMPQAINISPAEAKRIVVCRDQHLAKEIKLIEQEGIFIFDIFDPRYPLLLKQISFPPMVLYTKGDVDLMNQVCFAIVGTRIPTQYGITMAKEFSRCLASQGLVIVSGLAKGIDTASHLGALETGTTIAVIGSGLLELYPKENIDLAKRVEKQGLLISEFPLYCLPLRENFPRRNRIVSGLSKGVLVVEAALRSGALITANLALEQNRDVFALPGAINSGVSQGSHSLIKQGAKLVDSVEDIWSELQLAPIPKDSPIKDLSLTDHEQTVLAAITDKGCSFEDICGQADLEPASIHKTVFDLQIKGLIKEVKPSCFTRSKNL